MCLTPDSEERGDLQLYKISCAVFDDDRIKFSLRMCPADEKLEAEAGYGRVFYVPEVGYHTYVPASSQWEAKTSGEKLINLVRLGREQI